MFNVKAALMEVDNGQFWGHGTHQCFVGHASGHGCLLAERARVGWLQGLVVAELGLLQGFWGCCNDVVAELWVLQGL